ncbi:DUF3795 domain-containing protein [Desulfitobacterium sp.]|uniref:DUF3795 domain-containing protein n=1 Tax=Desulfitobacterium sp. TaxID=49981 RepID=UPI002B1F7C13|nr:DUF3795 domain-containing protein [Desulfitobacterium sp.]MEA4900537.1 DUF3795 domain-containing protein [Desulfitobacterium sp.]
MGENRRYTALCGLYCLDCIPSNRNLFRIVEQLEAMLADLQFEKYAAHKANRSKVFEDYGKFVEVFKEIKKVECKVPCYEGPSSELGCSRNCKVRSCVVDKHYSGCWDCESFSNCELLSPLKEFHPGLEHNLQMIKDYGIDNWIEKREKHYNW